MTSPRRGDSPLPVTSPMTGESAVAPRVRSGTGNHQGATKTVRPRNASIGCTKGDIMSAMAGREPPSDADPASRSEGSFAGQPASGRVPAGRMDTRTQVISWLWAVSPLVTFGLATPVTFLWAAQRVRSRHFAVAAVVYTVLVLLGLVLPDEDIASVFSTVAWLAGTAHALAFRSSVFGARPEPQDTAMEAAMDVALHRRLAATRPQDRHRGSGIGARARNRTSRSAVQLR